MGEPEIPDNEPIALNLSAPPGEYTVNSELPLAVATTLQSPKATSFSLSIGDVITIGENHGGAVTLQKLGDENIYRVAENVVSSVSISPNN